MIRNPRRDPRRDPARERRFHRRLRRVRDLLFLFCALLVVAGIVLGAPEIWRMVAAR